MPEDFTKEKFYSICFRPINLVCLLFAFVITDLQAQTMACDGIRGGTATIDACGVCVGGTTGLKPCKTLPNGSYFIKPVNSGLCIEDATALRQQTCASKNSQLWKVTKAGNFYQIQNTATNKYLAVAPEPVSYVFSTFKGDRDPGMKLSVYTSKDALNFNLLSDTGFEGTSSNLRDPSIIRHRDGKYYIAYTNAPTETCCGRQDHFSIATSTDLIRWTDLVKVPGGIPNMAHAWAPEWFVEGNTVRILVHIDTGAGDFKPYIFTALNNTLTAWSGPVNMNIGNNYIDSHVRKLGNIYYCFIKDEHTRFLEIATATNLTGPWKFVRQGDFAGWGNGMEGPNVVRLPGGGYRMFLDGQQKPHLYTDSQDLLNWTMIRNLPNIFNIVRHGTVINLDEQPHLSGTAVYTNTTAVNALWRLEDAGNNSFTIIPARNFALGTDIAGASALTGATLTVSNRNSKDNQRFTFSTSVVTGTEEDEIINQEENYISCYPNPARENFIINAKDNFEYVIYNMTGIAVETGNGRFSAKAGEHLQPGIYTVLINTSSQSKTLKVSKID